VVDEGEGDGIGKHLLLFFITFELWLCLVLNSTFGSPLSVLQHVHQRLVPMSCHLWDILST